MKLSVWAGSPRAVSLRPNFPTYVASTSQSPGNSLWIPNEKCILYGVLKFGSYWYSGFPPLKPPLKKPIGNPLESRSGVNEGRGSVPPGGTGCADRRPGDTAAPVHGVAHANRGSVARFPLTVEVKLLKR